MNVFNAPGNFAPLSLMTSKNCSDVMDCGIPTWDGQDKPIMLTIYGADGEAAVPLSPKRALELAQELLTRGVQAIKAGWPG